MSDNKSTISVSALISKFNVDGASTSTPSASVGRDEVVSKQSANGLSKQRKPIKSSVYLVSNSIYSQQVSLPSRSQLEHNVGSTRSSVVAPKLISSNDKPEHSVAISAKKPLSVVNFAANASSSSINGHSNANNIHPNDHDYVVVCGKTYRRLRKPSSLADDEAPRKPFKKPSHVDFSLYVETHQNIRSSRPLHNDEAEEELYDDVFNFTKPVVASPIVDDSDDLYEDVTNYSR